MRSPALWSSASLTLAFSAASAGAGAQPAFRLDPAIDVPVIATAAPVLGSWFLADELSPPYCAPRCDPATLNPFDRLAAGNHDPGLGTAADVTAIGVDVAALATVALVERFPDALVDGTVVIESVMVANATAILFNYAIRRPRPRLYGDEAPMDERTGGLAAMSAFSGHVANVVAATVATFQVLRRTAPPAVAWTELGVGLAASTFVGVARVYSGAHFPTDVLAGAALGASIGWLVPALHRSPVRVAPVASVGGAGLSMVGVF